MAPPQAGHPAAGPAAAPGCCLPASCLQQHFCCAAAGRCPACWQLRLACDTQTLPAHGCGTACPQVWNFVLSNATFRLAPTTTSSKRDEQEITVDKLKMVLVDAKVVAGS
jgi:hypothetical protein